MNGKVYKIDPVKQSITKANGAFVFQRVYFEMEDGSWAKTDVCQGFRNYVRWRPVIEKGVGTEVAGLKLKSKDTVDADSMVKIV